MGHLALGSTLFAQNWDSSVRAREEKDEQIVQTRLEHQLQRTIVPPDRQSSVVYPTSRSIQTYFLQEFSSRYEVGPSDIDDGRDWGKLGVAGTVLSALDRLGQNLQYDRNFEQLRQFEHDLSILMRPGDLTRYQVVVNKSGDITSIDPVAQFDQRAYKASGSTIYQGIFRQYDQFVFDVTGTDQDFPFLDHDVITDTIGDHIDAVSISQIGTMPGILHAYIDVLKQHLHDQNTTAVEAQRISYEIEWVIEQNNSMWRYHATTMEQETIDLLRATRTAKAEELEGMIDW
jgi:hypothetical protein